MLSNYSLLSLGWLWAYSNYSLYYSLASIMALSFSGLSGGGIGILIQGISYNVGDW